jgi:hypothetical protein
MILSLWPKCYVLEAVPLNGNEIIAANEEAVVGKMSAIVPVVALIVNAVVVHVIHK